ncbi:MAG: ABC transporter ATP-binding protein [Desulfuromonadaceae bacterium]|nr:ABC transporter ATP-binding protein [Desulfuromonadaceae bacterium]
MKMVLCRGLRKIYRQGKMDVVALDGIDLAIGKGEFVALAGPSGSGKTTLLNLIGGLDRPDEGEIHLQDQLINDMDQSRLAELRLRQIGFVFQAFNLIPVLSATENVEFILLLQGVEAGERRQRARAILDDVGLEGLYDRRPAELSGGQQQRVAVARAIVSDPAIVLADEPTANLDSTTGQGLLEMMKEMNEKKRVTFIFSTHDAMVMDYARRLILLHDGRIVEDRQKEGK